MRRATDPWESDHSGIMNTIVPERRIPSHQGPDARPVRPDLDVEGRELYYTYQVDNQAIVVPEVVGAVRALASGEDDAAASIDRTDQALGIRHDFLR